MTERNRVTLNFRVDRHGIAIRYWSVVPRVGEVVYLNDSKRDSACQYAAQVVAVGYYDSEEIRGWGWVRVDIDVEWVEG